jgi:hypothetical protein
VLLDDVLDIGVEVTGAYRESVRAAMGVFVLADVDCDGADAVGVCALAHERHDLLLRNLWRGSYALLEPDTAIVVVAKRDTPCAGGL